MINVGTVINITQASAVVFCSRKLNLAVNASAVTLAGSSFSPALTRAPSIGKAVQWVGGSGLDVSEIIQGYVQNGAYFDVLIAPLEDALANVTISII